MTESEVIKYLIESNIFDIYYESDELEYLCEKCNIHELDEEKNRLKEKIYSSKIQELSIEGKNIDLRTDGIVKDEIVNYCDDCVRDYLIEKIFKENSKLLSEKMNINTKEEYKEMILRKSDSEYLDLLILNYINKL